MVVHAQAHGSGSEQEVLPGLLDELKELCAPDTTVSADSGYYSEGNLQHLEGCGIDAFIPDGCYRKRDPRYAGQEQHRAKRDALWDKSKKTPAKAKLFAPSDFKLAEDISHLICPAGSGCIATTLTAIDGGAKR